MAAGLAHDKKSAPGQCQVQSLFLRGLEGDREAYRDALHMLKGLLRLFVRRQLLRVGRVEHDAEDIVQEALLAIHSRRHTYEREVPVTAWAYAIARYKMIDFLRATENEARQIPLEEADGVTGDHEAVERAMSVRDMIATLPGSLRVPVELTKLKGLSVREAAKRTGRSEATIRVSVHRGLRALARRFRSN